MHMDLIAEVAQEAAAGKLEAVRREYIRPGADVICVQVADRLRLVLQTMIGPGEVAPQDLGPDGAVQDDHVAAVDQGTDRIVAHALSPEAGPSASRRAEMCAGPVPQHPPTMRAPELRQPAAASA